VVNAVSGTVTPIDTSTGATKRAISVGVYSYPLTVTMIHGSQIAEVVDPYSGQISPIDLTTNTARKPINLGDTTFPLEIVLAP
jgi:hypothetical protein